MVDLESNPFETYIWQVAYIILGKVTPPLPNKPDNVNNKIIVSQLCLALVSWIFDMIRFQLFAVHRQVWAYNSDLILVALELVELG